MSSDDLARYIEPAARALWGEPNDAMSSGDEVRFGSRGARSINRRKGTFFDHSGEGDINQGGVLALIQRETGKTGKDAFEWLREHCGRPDDGPPPKSAHAHKASSQRPRAEIKATYDYTDASGELLYQVVRMEPKNFLQRRPSRIGDGSWIWALDAGEFMRNGPGKDWRRFEERKYVDQKCTERRRFEDSVEHGLYRIVELREAIAAGETVFIVEGEKDANNLWDLGVAATTNSGGAKHWNDAHADMFAGADVVVPVDNDRPGRERGESVAASLAGKARRTRILDLAKHWPAIGEKGDISDWIETGKTSSDLFQIVAKLPDWSPAPPAEFKSQFGAVSWSAMMTAAPQHVWLIKGLVTAGELAMLAGAMQSGKTFLALDLAMAVTRGVPFFERKVMQGGVIYQAGEDPTGVRAKRIPAYVKAAGLSFSHHLDFTLLTGPLNLWSGGDDHVAAFIAECRALAARMRSPLRLIVIDTYAKATTGADEISGKEMSIVLARAERIRQELSCAVLLVDHLNAEGARVRGAANKTANIDAVLICRFATAPGIKKVSDSEIMIDGNERKIREITNDSKFGGKNKNGEALRTPLRFVLPSVEIGRDEDGEAITSCIVAPPADSEFTATVARQAPKLGVKYSQALAALKKAIEQHGRIPPTSVRDAPRDRYGNQLQVCVTLAEWRDALAPIVSIEGEDAEKAKERTRDLLRKTVTPTLIDRGYIAKHGDWIWRTARRVAGLDYMPKAQKPDGDPPPTEPAIDQTTGEEMEF